MPSTLASKRFALFFSLYIARPFSFSLFDRTARPRSPTCKPSKAVLLVHLDVDSSPRLRFTMLFFPSSRDWKDASDAFFLSQSRPRFSRVRCGKLVSVYTLVCTSVRGNASVDGRVLVYLRSSSLRLEKSVLSAIWNRTGIMPLAVVSKSTATVSRPSSV